MFIGKVMIPKALVLNVIYAMHVIMKTATIHCIYRYTHTQAKL